MRAGLSKPITAITVILLLLFFHYMGLLKPITRAIWYVLMPVERTFYSLGHTGYNFISSYSQCQYLAKENEALRIQLTQQQLDQINFTELLAENDYLRNQLDFIRQQPNKHIITQIIGKPLLQNDLLIIDKGSNDGVEIGLPVIANQGVLVGKVYQVERGRSYITLLTNTKSSVAVTLNNNNHTQGILQGSMGLGLLIDLIPPGEEINIGDLVYSSGLEENITARYLIGEVASILNESGELYQKAEVKPAINYNALKILTVALP